MTNSNFYAAINETVSKYRLQLKSLMGELATIETAIQNAGNTNTLEYIVRRLYSQRDIKGRQIESVKAEAMNAVKVMCAKQRNYFQGNAPASYYNANVSRKINSDELQTVADVQAMLDKLDGASGSWELLRYAKEHGLMTGLVITGNAAVADALQDLPLVAKTIFDSASTDSVYTGLMGSETDLYAAFNS